MKRRSSWVGTYPKNSPIRGVFKRGKPAPPTLGFAFPKPEKASAKKRAANRAAKASLALPPPVAPEGTFHARRKRETGFMTFQRAFGCDVRAAFAEEFPDLWEFRVAGLVPGPCPPGAHIEFMHLPLMVGRRRGPDKHGAPGCALGPDAGHHKEIDGRVGGKGRWYVALGYEGQQRFRERLRSRALARWDALTPEERAEWDTRARAA